MPILSPRCRQLDALNFLFLRTAAHRTIPLLDDARTTESVPLLVRHVKTCLQALMLVSVTLGCVTPAQAERAMLIVDPADGRVVLARNANRPSYPASLTKLMTAYLLLEAVTNKRFALTDRIPVSAVAAGQLPRKLGLRAGSRVTVEQALLAMIVYSANDAAVVAAEAVAGSETKFASLMNAKARELGMTRSHFRNASGLPDPGQITTARDLAMLARALQRDFPRYYAYFSRQGFDLGKRHVTTHNNFVVTYVGADGLKTGFTCHAGYNLIASAKRDGRRLVGVVLGERDRVSRDQHMKRALDAAFAGETGGHAGFDLDTLPRAAGQGSADEPNQEFLADSCIHAGGSTPQTVDVHRASGWSLEFALEVEREDALDRTRAFIARYADKLPGAKPLLIPRWVGTIIYRAAVTGLERKDALKTCLLMRRRHLFCLVLSPRNAEHTLTHAMRTIKLAAAVREPLPKEHAPAD